MKNVKTLLVMSLSFAFALIMISNLQAADQSICDPDANVVLFDDGSTQACQLRNNFDINNITCKSGGPIKFYRNGKIESCMLYAEVTLSNTKCKPDSAIYFYNNGYLKACMKQD